MRRLLVAVLGAAVAAGLAVGTAAGAEPPQYTVVDLGAQGSLDWVDLNDDGDVSGVVGFPPGRAAVRRPNGTIVTFPPSPPYGRSRATATNNTGMTVGLSTLELGFGGAGAVWDGAGTTALGDLMFAQDVNDAGQVVGLRAGAGGNPGFLWQGGAVRDLRFGLFPGFVRPEAVNERGAVAGTGQDSFGIWALVWPAGATEALRLSRNQSSFSNAGSDINDDGVVVGRLQLGNRVVATRWIGGGHQHLPTLSGTEGQFGRANAINDRGEIVGATTELVPTDVGQVAALWTDDGVVDLNTLADVPPDYVFVEALDINNRGQILVEGHQPALYPSADCCGERFFLLTAEECAPIAEDDLASADGGEGLADADGDAIPDCWEEDGIPVEAADGSLVTYELPGADPERKDLYVEVDHMAGFPPEPGALEDVVAAFASAPVGNPDGSTGITLHLELDDEVPLVPALGFTQSSPGPGSLDDFWDLKAGGPGPCDGFFGSAPERSHDLCALKLGAKRLVYRYAIFGDTYASADNEGSGVAECGTVLSGGGLSDGCIGVPGNDLLVTIGHHWDEAELADVGGRRAMEAGAFMHELGHTLGLDHGGTDTVNCKPNYVSVMNYGYVLAPTATGAVRLLDYSRSAANLDEASLDEAAGAGGPAGTVVFGWMGLWLAAPGGSIDWNRDGAIGTASANVNWIQLLDACKRPSGLPPSKVDGNAIALETLNFLATSYDETSVPAPSAFTAIVGRPAPGNSFDFEFVTPTRVEIEHGVVFLTLPVTVAPADFVRARYSVPAENPLIVIFEDGGTREPEDDGTEWNLENITHRRELLRGFDDWTNLKYNVRDAQGFADLAGRAAHPEAEITFGEVHAVAVELLAQLDSEPPSVTATSAPPANAAGWHRGPVTVTLVATDDGSGVAEIVYDVGGPAVAVPGDEAAVVVDAEGVTTLTYFARDENGNAAAPETLVVRVDRGLPSALFAFEPAADDLVVRAQDALSGADPAPVAPVAVTPEKGKEERREYEVSDRAGNRLEVALLVKEKGRERLTAEVAGATDNRFEVAWKRDKAGVLTKLKQKLELGKGREREMLTGDYDRKRDVTVITVDGPDGKKQTLEQTGLVLLRLTLTSDGRLALGPQPFAG